MYAKRDRYRGAAKTIRESRLSLPSRALGMASPDWRALRLKYPEIEKVATKIAMNSHLES